MMNRRPVFHFSPTGKKVCDLCHLHISGKSSMRKHQDSLACTAAANVRRMAETGMVEFVGGWDTFFERICRDVGLPTERVLNRYKPPVYGRPARETKGFYIPAWVAFLFTRGSPRDLQGIPLPGGGVSTYDHACTMGSLILQRAKLDIPFRDHCTIVVGIGGTRALAAIALTENRFAFGLGRGTGV